jgi:hypothetical protein
VHLAQKKVRYGPRQSTQFFGYAKESCYRPLHRKADRFADGSKQVPVPKARNSLQSREIPLAKPKKCMLCMQVPSTSKYLRNSAFALFGLCA